MDGHLYTIYGTNISSNHEFSLPLIPASGEAVLDLSVSVSGSPPDERPNGWTELFEGTARFDDGQPMFRIMKRDEELLVRYTEVADFLVTRSRISATAYDRRYLPATEIYFLGTVLSVWLELRGSAVLHGAVVAIDDRAAVFLGDKGAGKTTMTCGFLQRGDALIADDLAVIHPGEDLVVPSAYPSLRLWPEQAEALFGSSDLTPVLPGETKCWAPLPSEGPASGFKKQGAPLAALYELRRVPGPKKVIFEQLGPAESALCLVRHSFVPNVAQALGLAPARLARFAEVTRKVPVYGVRYGGTIGDLAAVCDEVARHTRGLAGPGVTTV